MPRPNIPPSVLTARGVPVSLQDGTEVRVCFTFHSLMTLEDKHGGLAGAMDALGDTSGLQFGSILGIMAAGLEHELVEVEGENPGETVRVRLDDTETLAYLLDAREITTYAEALGKAFKLAFPSAKAGAVVDPPVAPETPTQDSPGLSGSTAAPSTSDGPTTSSGEAPQP